MSGLDFFLYLLPLICYGLVVSYYTIARDFGNLTYTEKIGVVWLINGCLVNLLFVACRDVALQWRTGATLFSLLLMLTFTLGQIVIALRISKQAHERKLNVFMFWFALLLNLPILITAILTKNPAPPAG